jgi:hypothetical protein
MMHANGRCKVDWEVERYTSDHMQNDERRTLIKVSSCSEQKRSLTFAAAARNISNPSMYVNRRRAPLRADLSLDPTPVPNALPMVITTLPELHTPENSTKHQPTRTLHNTLLKPLNPPLNLPYDVHRLLPTLRLKIIPLRLPLLEYDNPKHLRMFLTNLASHHR